MTVFREFSSPIIQWLYYENGIAPINWTAFKDIAAAVTGHMSYEPPPYFPRFLQLPAEFLKPIYHQNLLEVRQETRLSNDYHHNPWGKCCCMWIYQGSLALCDKSETTLFPQLGNSSYLASSIPALALTCRQLQGDVIVHMLEHTGRFDLDFKKSGGGTWFYDLLVAIPRGKGLRMINNLNFALEHCFRSSPAPLSTRNPTVELAAASQSLCTIGIAIRYPTIPNYDHHRTTIHTVRPLDRILGLSALQPLIKCESLRRIYIYGIFKGPSLAGRKKDLDDLVAIGKGLMRGVLLEQERIGWQMGLHIGNSNPRYLYKS